MKDGPWLLFKVVLFSVERCDLSTDALLRVDRLRDLGLLMLLVSVKSCKSWTSCQAEPRVRQKPLLRVVFESWNSSSSISYRSASEPETFRSAFLLSIGWELSIATTGIGAVTWKSSRAALN